MFINWNFETWLDLAKIALVLQVEFANAANRYRASANRRELHWTTELLEEDLQLIVDGNKLVKKKSYLFFWCGCTTTQQHFCYSYLFILYKELPTWNA